MSATEECGGKDKLPPTRRMQILRNGTLTGGTVEAFQKKTPGARDGVRPQHLFSIRRSPASHCNKNNEAITSATVTSVLALVPHHRDNQ